MSTFQLWIMIPELTQITEQGDYKHNDMFRE